MKDIPPFLKDAGLIAGTAIGATIVSGLTTRTYNHYLGEKYGKFNERDNFLISGMCGVGAILGAGIIFSVKFLAPITTSVVCDI